MVSGFGWRHLGPSTSGEQSLRHRGLGEIAPTTQARQGHHRGHRQQDRADRLGNSGTWRGLPHGHSDLNSGGVALLSPSAGVKRTVMMIDTGRGRGHPEVLSGHDSSLD
jgi:hypothetical protein